MNGPTSFNVSAEESLHIANQEFTSQTLGMDLNLSELFRLDPKKFLGKTYAEKYPDTKEDLVCLLKVLSVRTALSI